MPLCGGELRANYLTLGVSRTLGIWQETANGDSSNFYSWVCRHLIDGQNFFDKRE